MNVLRRCLRRLKRPAPLPEPPPKPNPPRPEFSYTIYWTRQVRSWDPARRAAVQQALLPVLNQSGFEAGPYQRLYQVPGLDDQPHAGLSLIALQKVLEAFTAEDARPADS